MTTPLHLAAEKQTDALIQAEQEDQMDKYFLLITQTLDTTDCFHSYHAWFQTKEELLAFEQADCRRERELAIEILRCRILEK